MNCAVKTSLTSLLKDTEHKEPLINKINEMVKHFSKLDIATRLLLNSVIMYALHFGRELPPIDQTLIVCCENKFMKTRSKLQNDLVDEVYDTFGRDRGWDAMVEEIDCPMLSYFKYDIALKIIANYKTHCQENIWSRIGSFVKFRLKEMECFTNPRDYNKAAYFVVECFKDPDVEDPEWLNNADQEVKRKLQDVTFDVGELLGTFDFTTMMKNNWQAAIPVLFEISRRFETTMSDVEPPRAFATLPSPKLKAKYMPINSSHLPALLKHMNITEQAIKDIDADEWWERLIDIKGLKSAKMKKFSGSIATDGLSCTVHFVRRVRDPPRPVFNEDKTFNKLMKPEDKSHQVIGIDPGRGDLAYAYYEIEGVNSDYHTDKEAKLRISTKMYHHMAGKRNVERRRQRYESSVNLNVEDEEKTVEEVLVSLGSLKTGLLVRYLKSVTDRFKILEEMMDKFCHEKRVKRLRWSSYIGYQRAKTKMGRLLKCGKKEPIFALGGALIKPNSRGHASSPVQQLKKILLVRGLLARTCYSELLLVAFWSSASHQRVQHVPYM